jgi:hypothetical protein
MATINPKYDDHSENPRLTSQEKQRISDIDEDIKAQMPENDSLGYPLSPSIKKSEQFFHDASLRLRQLIEFCLTEQKRTNLREMA